MASGSIFFDAQGMVIATEGLPVRHPWEVRESGKFAGRFYFFNLETSKSEWSLQPWQLGLDGLGEGKEDVTPAGGKSHASTGNLAAMDVTYGVETSAAAAVDSQQSTAASSWGLGNLLGSKKGGSMKHSSSANDLSSMGEMGTSATGGGGYSGTMGSMLLGSKTGRQDLRTSNNRPASGGSLQHSASTGSLGEEGGWGAGLGHLEGGRAPVRVLDGLGQGGYSCVVACEHTATGQPFALKVISKSKVSRKRDRARLRLELSVMMELPPSPFLQRCHMAFESPSQLFFVLDFVSGGDLFFHLVQKISEKGWGFPEQEARVMLSETVLGLEHMHAHGLIHRDIKVENIMLDGAGHVKLIDFGLSCELRGYEEPVSPTGSLIYMAPEMVRDHMGGRHTDWWALGVLSYELLTGRTPWSSLTDKKVIRKEIQTMVVAPPRKISPPAGHFVCSLLRQDHRKRLGTASDTEVRTAAFFNGVDWEATLRGANAPAFVPGRACVHARDREAALRSYRARRYDFEAGEGKGEGKDDGPWFLGLDVVSEHPPCR